MCLKYLMVLYIVVVLSVVISKSYLSHHLDTASYCLYHSVL